MLGRAAMAITEKLLKHFSAPRKKLKMAIGLEQLGTAPTLAGARGNSKLAMALPFLMENRF